MQFHTKKFALPGNEFEYQLAGVLVSGEDKEDYWGNPSRPNKDWLE